MNPLLQVKLRFTQEGNLQRPGARNLKSKDETSTRKIDKLIEDLNSVLLYYSRTNKIIDGIVIDANYNDIIAKTKRIKELLKPSRRNVNDTIVGARFSEATPGSENHIITYYVSPEDLRLTISKLSKARAFLEGKLNGKATASNFNKPDNKIDYSGYGLTETQLRDVIVDCSVVDSFSVPKIISSPESDSFLVTFYKTELPPYSVFEKLHIDGTKYPFYFYGSDTVSVTKELYEILNSKVPYLISMISADISKISTHEILDNRWKDTFTISSPTNEPTIGVIDTLFDDSVFFSSWVENMDYLDDIEMGRMQPSWKDHGTEVTSIIVDGPLFNPWLDDGCGRFKVRHFGVCGDSITPSRLINKIKDVVSSNPDIHVWNLSLGTEDEVSKNFVSFDGAALDEIQANKNVVFVISGTNDNREIHDSFLRVGSPADSLNSIVVNSVRRDGSPASYSREGPILSFFNKPDVSYYGGDYDERIRAYSPDGVEDVYGSSFAAPWISRKLCYLIDIMGLPREVAKALIIDSAAGWDYKQTEFKSQKICGYGIVPIDISEILSTRNDEIRFTLYGSSESYKTANYAIPVPKDEDGNFPYIARATLCYFPECSRFQGVDYTNRELSLQFGRINKKDKIDDINENIQDDTGTHVGERQSRKDFRKWDNTKFISKVLKKNKPLKAYQDRLWGIAITSKERLGSRTERPLNFGAVITLREIKGINRIQDFIRACNLRGWIVNELDVQQRIDVYNANQSNIEFES